MRDAQGFGVKCSSIDVVVMVEVFKGNKILWLIIAENKHKMPDVSALWLFQVISEVFVMLNICRSDNFAYFLQNLLVQTFIFL